MAVSGVVFDAALVQSGVVIARNLEELLDMLVGFTCPVLPKGNKVGLLVEAGGGAVAASDMAEALGFELPALSADSQQELVSTLTGVIPPFSSPRNPVDIVWSPATGGNEIYLQCSQIMLKEVDTLMLISYANYNDDFAQGMVRLRDEMDRPIFIIPGHPTESRAGMSLLTRNGIPTFTIPERALNTLSAMLRYSNYLCQS